jgi:signal transduction histidine kinase
MSKQHAVSGISLVTSNQPQEHVVQPEQADENNSLMEILAHDLRLMLTSSALTLDLLMEQDSEQTPFQRKHRLDELKRSHAKSIALMEDLLSMHKAGKKTLSLSLQLVDLKSVIEDACEIMSAQARQKNVRVVAHALSTEVVADRIKLLQVLTNLISNAIKHAPEQSVISIETVLYRGEVEITISDEGRGVPHEKIAGLFGKYFQACSEDAETGFGLGLSICKSIVSKHGGSIGTRSERGKGTTFFFTLPVDADDDNGHQAASNSAYDWCDEWAS